MPSSIEILPSYRTGLLIRRTVIGRCGFESHRGCQTGCGSAWLERVSGGHEVVGSSPAIPTMKNEQLARVQLRDAAGHSHMNVLVDWRPNLRPGVSITLKDSEDPTRLWEVLSVDPPQDRSSINRGWNNNI